MDYKEIVAKIIAYATKRAEMAEFDLNITQEEVYEGEIYSLSQILSFIDMLISGKEEADEKLKHCVQLVNEVLEERKSGEKSN